MSNITRWIGVFLSVFTCGNALAQLQLSYDRLDDFGDNAVQTFVAEEGGLFRGVSLVLFGHGSSSDVTVKVRDLQADGSLSPLLRAQGTLPAPSISTSTPEWQFIEFVEPLRIEAGTSYGLVLNQDGSNSNGFVDFGTATANPYLNGRVMYECEPGDPLLVVQPDLDLAFQNSVNDFRGQLTLFVDPVAETITANGWAEYAVDSSGDLLLTSGSGSFGSLAFNALGTSTLLRVSGAGTITSRAIFLADGAIGFGLRGTDDHGVVVLSAVEAAAVSYSTAPESRKAYLELAAASGELLNLTAGAGPAIQLVLVPEPCSVSLLGLLLVSLQASYGTRHSYN